MPLHELRRVTVRVRPRFFLLSLLASAALSACGGSAVPPSPGSAAAAVSSQAVTDAPGAVAWPQTYHDGGHTNFNPNETLLSAGNVSGLKELAGLTIGNGVQALALSAGRLFVIGPSGTGNLLAAYNAKTFKLLWSENIGGTPLSTLAIDGNVVVTECTLSDGGNHFGGVCGYNTSSGAPVWQWGRSCGSSCVPESELDTPITFENGVVYFGYLYEGDPADYIVALNATTGGVIYDNSLGSVNRLNGHAPAVGGGNIFYSCFADSAVCAFNSSGGPLWKSATGTPLNALAYSNGLVFDHYSYPTGNSGVLALNPSNGAVVHSYTYCTQSCGNNPNPVAVAKGMVYVTSADNSGSLYAYHVGGALAWSKLNLAGATSPSVANGVVYEPEAGSNSPTVQAFDATTGALLWTSPYVGAQNGGIPGASAPVIANGALYAVSNTCGFVCSFTVH